MHHELNQFEEANIVKDFWRKNGKSILFSIALAFLAIIGISWYKSYQQNNQDQLFSLYQKVLNNQQSGNVDNQVIMSELMQKKYPRATYSALASLVTAGSQAQAGKLDAASQSLNWVVEHAKEKVIRDFAIIRLARIDIDQDKAAKALTLLKQMHQPELGAYVNMVKGDAYTQLKEYANAKKYYQIAQSAFDAQAIEQQYLTMKLADLPVSNTVSDASETKPTVQPASRRG